MAIYKLPNSHKLGDGALKLWSYAHLVYWNYGTAPPSRDPMARPQSRCQGMWLTSAQFRERALEACRKMVVAHKREPNFRLTGAFYVGNGWVAGGCWDDYY